MTASFAWYVLGIVATLWAGEWALVLIERWYLRRQRDEEARFLEETRRAVERYDTDTKAGE